MSKPAVTSRGKVDYKKADGRLWEIGRGKKMGLRLSKDNKATLLVDLSRKHASFCSSATVLQADRGAGQLHDQCIKYNGKYVSG